MIRISSGADCSALWSDSFLEGRMEEKVVLSLSINVDKASRWL